MYRFDPELSSGFTQSGVLIDPVTSWGVHDSDMRVGMWNLEWMVHIPGWFIGREGPSVWSIQT